MTRPSGASGNSEKGITVYMCRLWSPHGSIETCYMPAIEAAVQLFTPLTYQGDSTFFSGSGLLPLALFLVLIQHYNNSAIVTANNVDGNE